MQTEHRKYLSARTIVLLGLLTGVVVGLLGCAHAAAPIRIAVPVPLLVKQDCEATNIFEKCKLECMEKKPSQQAALGLETQTKYRCECKPWDL